MAQVINTNIASLNAQRNLNRSQSALSTSLQRLSSGLRINSAKDDAAGLAISERFTAQIRGLNTAVRNSNDGISLAQTAEGALAEVTSNLQRIRELAIQSANATNSDSDRAAMQQEVSQLVEEIDRVAGMTNFNGVQLLDGSFADQAFQVGANVGETITVSSIVDATKAGLGLDNGTASAGGTTAITGGVTAGNLTINGTAVAATAQDAVAIATAISAVDNVAATASDSAVTLGALSGVDTGITVTVNGTDHVLGGGGAIDQATLITDLGTSLGAGYTVADVGGDVVITKADGANLTVSYSVGGAGAFDNLAVDTDTTGYGEVTVTSTGEDLVIAGSDAAGLGLTAGTTASSGNTMSVSTVAGANALITAVDAALSTVNGSRATLGAVQNRFESVVNSLQTSVESMSAARSRILDADFAAETASLTKSQILQQAGTAMLAQANSLPQNVLSLLQ